MKNAPRRCSEKSNINFLPERKKAITLPFFSWPQDHIAASYTRQSTGYAIDGTTSLYVRSQATPLLW